MKVELNERELRLINTLITDRRGKIGMMQKAAHDEQQKKVLSIKGDELALLQIKLGGFVK